VKNKKTNNYNSPKQGVFPVFLEDCLDLMDPVMVYDRLMEEEREKLVGIVPNQGTSANNVVNQARNKAAAQPAE
jgi:hypothetical protein